MFKRLTLLSLNYYEGLIYLLNIFFAHLFLNLLIFYVKHIITFTFRIIYIIYMSHYTLIRARVAQWFRLLVYLTIHTSLSPIRRGFSPGFVNYKKGCTLLAVASDNVYQLFVHGRWFSPASSSTTNWSSWYSWNIAESGVKTPKIKSLNIIFW